MTEDGPDTSPPLAPRSIRRNVAHMMSAQLVTWVLATIASIVIPRFLGPATLGDLRLAGSLWLIAATFAGLGTAMYLQLQIARHQREGLALVGPILVIRTIAIAVAGAGVALYVSLTAQSTEFVIVASIMGAGSVVSIWSGVFGAVFVGLERMSTTAFAGVVSKFVGFVATIAVLVLGAGAIGVVTVTVVVGFGGLVYLAWRFHSISRLRFRGWHGVAPGVVRASVTFMAAGFALVLYQQIDLIVISWVADSDALGWYGAADALFGSSLFPATVLMASIFPTLGRLFVSDEAQMRSLVSRTASILLLLSVPIGLGTTIIAPEFAPLLYGEDFAETGIVLAILGPVIILTSGTILFGGTALATERGRLWVWVMFGSAALTVPLDLALVPWADDRFGNGAIGGALAYLVTEAVQFSIGLALIAPYLANRAVGWRTLRILTAGGVMFAVGWPLRDQMLLIPVIVCAATYAIAVVAFRVLGDDERRAIGKVLERIGIANSWSS